MNVFRLLVALVVLAAPQGLRTTSHAAPAAVEPVVVHLSARETWFPNTALRWQRTGQLDLAGLAAIPVAGRGVYFATPGGLGRYDPATGALTVHAVPNAGPYFAVGGLASVGGCLWAAIPQQGVVPFDPTAERFGEPLLTGYRNVEILEDLFTGEIWVSSQKDLLQYLPAERTWHSHGAFVAGLGAHSYDGWLFGEENAICFSPRGDGGLFRYDKTRGAWSVVRTELVQGGQDPGPGLRVGPFFATPTHLVAFVEVGNAFDLRAAILDRTTNAWTPLQRSELGRAFDLLARDLPRARWAGAGNQFYSWLEAVADRQGLPESTHPYAFSAEELERTGKSAAALRDAMTAAGTWNLSRLALAKAAMLDGVIVGFERAYDPPRRLAEVHLPQVGFTGLLGPVDPNRVLVRTPAGIAELTLEPPALVAIEGPFFFSRFPHVCRDEATGVYVLEPNEPGLGHEPAPRPRWLLVSPSTRTMGWVELAAGAADLGRLDARCVLKMPDGRYRVFDPASWSLGDVDDPSGRFTASGGPASRIEMPGGGLVTLRPDGLVWTRGERTPAE